MGKRILALILMAVMMLTMGAQAVDTFAVTYLLAQSWWCACWYSVDARSNRGKIMGK